MYAFKIACWALIFIFRLRFPPGVSIATIMNYWILYIVLTRFLFLTLLFVTTVVLDVQCILSIYNIVHTVPYQHDLSVHQTCHQILWQHQLGNYALISLPHGHDLKQTAAKNIFLVTKGNTQYTTTKYAALFFTLSNIRWFYSLKRKCWSSMVCY